MISAKPKIVTTSYENYADDVTSLLEEQGLLVGEEESAFKRFLLGW